MIEKLLALAPKTANCKLHFFVPFNFRAFFVSTCVTDTYKVLKHFHMNSSPIC